MLLQVEDAPVNESDNCAVNVIKQPALVLPVIHPINSEMSTSEAGCEQDHGDNQIYARRTRLRGNISSRRATRIVNTLFFQQEQAGVYTLNVT